MRKKECEKNLSLKALSSCKMQKYTRKKLESIEDVEIESLACLFCTLLSSRVFGLSSLAMNLIESKQCHQAA